MTQSESSPIADLRRIVTTHNHKGIVGTDSELSAEVSAQWIKGTGILTVVEGTQELRSAAIWVTQDSIPTNDNNNRDVYIASTTSAFV
jgi:hypothetical protein